jgi:Tol biopolymer transport system component
MNIYLKFSLLFILSIGMRCYGEEKQSIRANWEMPPRCSPLALPRIQDLKEELRRTGYRLVIAIHPKNPDESKGQTISRDLYIINADGTGLKRLTNTPHKDEHIPRTSTNGKFFTYNQGKYLVDVKTLKTKNIDGGYVWTPDSQRTVQCGNQGIVYTDIHTGKKSSPIPVKRKVWLTDMTFDGKWFIFEIRNYLGEKYTIDFMSSNGGEIQKMPNYPKRMGECHPAFSPDGKWMCWNAGGGIGIRKFDPALPGGTDGKIISPPNNAKVMGQDPCGRWSHCGRYIAYVKIPSSGSWRVHSPLCILRIADGKTITISPPGWVGHHWDYDWIAPAESSDP